MYKATSKDIKNLIDNGEEVRRVFGSYQPVVLELAYYSAPSWNWSYRIGITSIKTEEGTAFYEVVTQFGEVKGGRMLHLPSLDLTNDAHKELFERQARA